MNQSQRPQRASIKHAFVPRLASTLACLGTFTVVAMSAVGAVGTMPVRTAAAESLAVDPGAPDLIYRVVELTNVERQNAGLAPLTLEPSLTQAAQDYAGVLASSNCFAHTCGAVPDFSQRVANAGYSGWMALGENIAAGQPSADDVVAAWMASPGHRANILNPAYTEIGVGEAPGGAYGISWTQEFGTR
jgi:uncharacterized protein YkwD